MQPVWLSAQSTVHPKEATRKSRFHEARPPTPRWDKALLGAGAPHWAGTVQGAIRATAEAKRAFAVEDITARARRALAMAIRHGTTAMRTRVEVDPTLGFKAMKAILPLRDAYAWVIDLQDPRLPQEGLFTAPETEALMRETLAMGADSTSTPSTRRAPCPSATSPR